MKPKAFRFIGVFRFRAVNFRLAEVVSQGKLNLAVPFSVCNHLHSDVKLNVIKDLKTGEQTVPLADLAVRKTADGVSQKAVTLCRVGVSTAIISEDGALAILEAHGERVLHPEVCFAVVW